MVPNYPARDHPTGAHEKLKSAGESFKMKSYQATCLNQSAFACFSLLQRLYIFLVTHVFVKLFVRTSEATNLNALKDSSIEVHILFGCRFYYFQLLITINIQIMFIFNIVAICAC